MDINNLWSGYDLNSKKQNTRCLAVNTILEGKYLVGPVLGQGGFGITYVGFDLNMETKIAIKEYFPVELVSRDTTTMHGDRVLSLSGEKSVTYKAGLKKYVAEAQNVSQFSEIPGVVSVKDFFYANETAYIVMEFIDGISLKDYLKEKGGRLSEEETLKIMKPVLEALVQVHKCGIIHRDISPDNIMLTFKDGNVHNQIESVKLIDFGAARMTEKNDQKSLTIILKHGYAPEEQYRTHGEQGAWTDVYALCAVLYRMLTGETPVPAMDRMFKDELKSLEQCGAKVSANTVAAIWKGLAVKKDDRIQSVQELIEALYEGIKVNRAVAGKKNKNNTVIAACVGLAAAVIIGGGLFFGGKGSAGNLENPVISESGSSDLAESGTAGERMNETTADQLRESNLNFSEEEEIGEQIVSYSAQNSMDGRWYHLLICRPDGTVIARGVNTEGQCEVSDWGHMVSVKAGAHHSLGLREDGVVMAVGSNEDGQCDVEHWKDIVQICADNYISVGVTKDGHVLTAGSFAGSHTGKMDGETLLRDMGSWTDIKSVAVGTYCAAAGLKKDGTLVVAGTDIEQKIDGWENVEQIQFAGSTIVGLEADGTVRTVDLLNEVDAREMLIQHTSRKEWFDGIPKMRYLNGTEGITEDGERYPEENIEDENQAFTNLLSMDSLRGIGLKEDGTFLEYYENRGNTELGEFQDLKWAQLVSDSLILGIVGQTSDGRILCHGVSKDFYNDIEKEQKTIKQYIGDGLWLFDDGTLINNRHRDQYSSLPGENLEAVIRNYNESVICVMSDGTIQGIEPYGEWESPIIKKMSDWKDIIQVSGYYYPIWGLTADGKVLSTMEDEIQAENIIAICGAERTGSDAICLGLKDDGTVQVIASGNDVNGCTQVESWSNIVQIDMSDSHTVGLCADGTVVAAGSNHCGQCDVETWKDVVQIDAYNQCTIGVTKDGELLVAGSFY